MIWVQYWSSRLSSLSHCLTRACSHTRTRPHLFKVTHKLGATRRIEMLAFRVYRPSCKPHQVIDGIPLKCPLIPGVFWQIDKSRLMEFVIYHFSGSLSAWPQNKEWDPFKPAKSGFRCSKMTFHKRYLCYWLILTSQGWLTERWYYWSLKRTLFPLGHPPGRAISNFKMR